ncbi:DUF6634 family protein [Bosea robiniae]|uniref:SnoaL-like domain-containing protein n=1 Tax=Bosea robiniae TaxID=1036780 RepID=A0ABY0P0C6_9HYPH|nr:DUF6634 family protein [Bosea robiniae]SDG45487.1 hypothetical protein SAMN05421844_10465 [Bosea robiniae]
MAFTDTTMRGQALERIELLRTLSWDLAAIFDGGMPTLDQLRDAPVLRDYALSSHQVSCMEGFVSGHPLLGEGRRIKTSQLFCVDHDLKWIRTLSRFYRLEGA